MKSRYDDDNTVHLRKSDQTTTRRPDTASRIERYLMREGPVPNGHQMKVVCRKLGIDIYSPEKYPPAPELVHVLHKELATQYSLVPLKRQGNTLWVATDQPTNIGILDKIEDETGLAVEPVYAPNAGVLFLERYGADITLNVSDEKLEHMALQVSDSPSAPPGSPHPETETLVLKLIAQVMHERASHAHFWCCDKEVTVHFRVDGHILGVELTDKSQLAPAVARIKQLAAMDIARSGSPGTGHFSVLINGHAQHIKVTSIPTLRGENLVLHFLGRSLHGVRLETLGMSKPDCRKLKKAMQHPNGLILCCGPDGHGKTTLLYSILNTYDTMNANVFTLENPVEHSLETISQVQFDPRKQLTYAQTLRGILQQNPDVIMVDELGDTETAHLAVQAAQSGCRVISTLHAGGAAAAIAQLLAHGIPPYLVATTLLISISGRLARKVCPHCKEPYTPSQELLALFNVTDPTEYTFQRGQGCKRCHGLGYSGRTGLFEVLAIDQQIQNLILKKATFLEIRQEAVRTGRLTPLKQDALEKAAKGIITLEEAASVLSL